MPFPVGNWSYTDWWSVEFISPSLAGTNPLVVGWDYAKKYQVHARTDATGLKLQPILTILDSNGNPRTFSLPFVNLTSDDNWQSIDADFTNPPLPSGRTMTISFRIFGTRSGLQGNSGKKVLIDQVTRIP